MSKYSYPLFFENEKKLSVGKNNDKVSFIKCQIGKEDDKFKLTEIIETKNETKTRNYTGKPYDEETSKYIYLKFNESTNYFEAYPAEKWYFFKKDMPNYEGISVEEYEKKSKQSDPNFSLLRNKGGQPNKKTRKKKVNLNKNFLEGNYNNEEELDEEFNNNNDSEEEQKKKKIEDLEDSYPSENDTDLKDLDSDIEEKYKDKKEIIEKENNDNLNNENNSSDSYDFSDENDKENLSIDNEDSNIDEEDLDNQILGKKTKRFDNSSKIDLMTECLNNMLSRNKKMTYEKIAKEMGKQFSSEDIELYLQEILSNNTSMYNDAEDTYYFKK